MTTAAQARDLAYLWERHRARWESALAPSQPDPPLLCLCEDEARGFATALDERRWGVEPAARDMAWEAVSLAADTLGAYARMAGVALACRHAGFPTTLPRAYPALADACREALRVADRFIIELLPASPEGLSVDPCLTDGEALARWDADQAEEERLNLQERKRR